MEPLKLVLSDGREAWLHPGRTTLGRDPGNDIVLNLAPVSRYHAEIQFDGQICLLEDLGSTNGTAIDGRSLPPRQPWPMRPGSVITMGGLHAFLLEESKAAAAPFSGDLPAETPSARAGISPWIYALGGLAAVLLLALLVLAAVLLMAPADGEPANATGTPLVAIVLPVVTDLLGSEAASTVLTAAPTLPAAVPPAAPEAQGQAAAAGQAAGQTEEWQDILEDVQDWSTVMAPLFPVGTPGAPPGSERYAAPQLVAPGNGASFRGEGAIILLTWEAVGELAGNEYYHVSLRYLQQEQPQFQGTWTQATEWRVPEWLYGQADQGRFEWDVTVRQERAIRDDSKEGPALSPKSETRFFLWTQKSEEDGFEEREEPTSGSGKSPLG